MDNLTEYQIELLKIDTGHPTLERLKPIVRRLYTELDNGKLKREQELRISKVAEFAMLILDDARGKRAYGIHALDSFLVAGTKSI